MSTTTAPTPLDFLDTIGVPEDSLVHQYCRCSPDVSLCGTPLPDGPDWDPSMGGVICVVCDDLDRSGWPCPRCQR